MCLLGEAEPAPRQTVEYSGAGFPSTLAPSASIRSNTQPCTETLETVPAPRELTEMAHKNTNTMHGRKLPSSIYSGWCLLTDRFL